MRQFGEGRFRQQVKHLQHQFLQDGNLPFSDILSTELIKQALTALEVIVGSIASIRRSSRCVYFWAKC